MNLRDISDGKCLRRYIKDKGRCMTNVVDDLTI